MSIAFDKLIVAIAYAYSKCYYFRMNLKKYIEGNSITALAKAVGVAPAVVHQWMTGNRPVPVKRCHCVVKATNGLVQLKDLRPNDWYLIWPELTEERQP